MLFLLFQLGENRYAVDARCVVEVLPLVELKRLPQAPRGIAGIFNYRGRPVPALDLCELTLQRPARACFSTRIIVVQCPGGGAQDRLLGLVAEHATETYRRARTDFVDTGLQVPAAPYLGPAAPDEQGVIQWLRVDRLFPENLREALFTPGLLSTPQAG